jgi:hypothetical protein
MDYTLRLTQAQHAELKAHLFPGDGKEAVALALCGRRSGAERHVFVAHRVVPVPYSECKVRSAEQVTWSTEILDTLLLDAARRGLAVLKVHGHPGGYEAFSLYDDESDRSIFAAVSNWLDNDAPHASVVMLPDGRMFGRAVGDGELLASLSSIVVVGDDLRIWHPPGTMAQAEAFTLRHAQLFGQGTTSILRRLAIGVVGCSGTGSIVVEQLVRLGAGKLVLVDPDLVEEKNLNRILNTGKEDVYLRRRKVDAQAVAIARTGLGQELLLFHTNLATPAAVRALAECDVVFGCMDGVEGRHLLNRLATFYNLPYIDVGVRLDADGRGGIDQIAGSVHYLHPGGSSLLTRGVYTMAQVEAEELRRTNPKMHQEQRQAGYLRGVAEDRPAVITVNMFFSALAVAELLARLHPYRNHPNADFAWLQASLVEVQFHNHPEAEAEVDQALAKHVGRGDVDPLLERPSLS